MADAQINQDWTADVKKYIPTADEAAVKKIVKYLGIALQKRDAAMVACGEKTERDRIRDNFLKKKLGLSLSDAELDKALIDTCQKMKGDRDKSRVAFYYMLAEKYGKLSAFG